MKRPIRIIGAGAVLAVTALVASGCATSSSSPTPSSTEKVTTIDGAKFTFDAKLRAMLPKDVTDRGILSFSTDAAGPPRTFVDDDGKIVGVIPDVLDALGAKLGVQIDLQKNTFDTEVPGVQSQRFDATTGTGDFPARRAVLDMVDYYKAGYLYLVKSGNPKKVTNDVMSQCGLRVGVLKGTTQETLVTNASKACTAAGKPAIDLQSFNNVLLEVPLEADRVDVVWENTSTGVQVAKESPKKFAVAGDPIFSAYLAFGVLKTRTQLRDALQATLQSMLDDGTMLKIFKKWGQQSLIMDKISMNSDVRS